ncbi:ribonuclease Y [Demequina sp. B12]|uniref:ribonuclease Y n=1 Tax=Demequina sp. B12 TaxID=2992757 RepID=UPI00237A2F71|nr:ribonuclease Y [Demequina sp. B12]MDE0573358.1 ribonuclease Y [Demequina sp. B12]
MGQLIATVATLVLLLASLLVVSYARREASEIRRSSADEVQALRSEAKDLLSEAQRREERVSSREKELAADQRAAQKYARVLDERAAVVARDERRVEAEREAREAEQLAALADAAHMDVADAKAELERRLVAQVKEDARAQVRRIERQSASQAKRRSREILVTAMQRQAAATSAETSSLWFDLPNEEMKGRIIGREGRNIRAFESLTGVNVIVEEGVNAVQLSSFDVERREIAEVTLRTLVEDGRIHPQRVETVYAKVHAETEQRHLDAGFDAIEDAGVRGFDEEVVAALGRLRLRTSYGQNVLAHLVECAQIAADIAREVGADEDLARRAAFLHDIGKAFTHEKSGTHAAIGAEFAAAHGESKAVVNAIAAHHDEVAQETVEAVIVQVADAVSASRTGARRDDADSYTERLENLEHLVAEHTGVSRVLAMSAGRDVRVMVQPDEVSDEALPELARTIAEHISNDLSFPGEIKVTVIRELRADAVAG